MWKRIKEYFEIISQEEIDCAIQGACYSIYGKSWIDIQIENTIKYLTAKNVNDIGYYWDLVNRYHMRYIKHPKHSG